MRLGANSGSRLATARTLLLLWRFNHLRWPGRSVRYLHPARRSPKDFTANPGGLCDVI